MVPRLTSVWLWVKEELHKVKESLRTGISFGLTSAVITTLGLMVGLHAGTHSKLAVLGGILTIAVADAFSDALGIHISEEWENVHTVRQIWSATVATFLTKFVFAMTFSVAVIFLPLGQAVPVNVVWGFFILAVMSYRMAVSQGERPGKVVGEHLLIAAVVIGVSHAVGHWVASVVGADRAGGASPLP